MSTMHAPWDTWPVHGLCKYGNHEMCKKYEDWNWRAMHICGCTECDHPKPTREQFEAHEVRVYGHVRFGEKEPDELDSDGAVDVASWFVKDDDEADGHEEAQNTETPMSTTDVPTGERQVTHSDPQEDPAAGAPVTPEGVEDEAVEAHEVASDDADATADAGTDDAADEDDEKRERGQLEAEVKDITDRFRKGNIVLPDDKKLTPHYIALAIEKAHGYSEPPSTGAVAAVLKRWENYGYAEFGEGPFHFKDLTDEGKERGLDSLRTEFKEARKEERRLEREAAKAEADENDDESDSDEE